MLKFTDKRILMLRPEQIRQSKYQPRRAFDESELKALADSISLLGLIEPVAVRKAGSGYEIISGERRLRAAVSAGLRRIPCILYRVAEKEAAFYAVSENLQHKALNFFEEARSISNLVIRYRLTLGEAAMRLGISESEISAKLKLLRLDEYLQRKIVAAGLCEQQAKALLKIDEFSREEVLGIIISENLNIAQTEELIESIIEPETKTEQAKENALTAMEPVRKNFIEDTRILINTLEKLVLTVEDSMMDVEFKKNESSKFIEYKFKVKKQENSLENCKQLKIC